MKAESLASITKEAAEKIASLQHKLEKVAGEKEAVEKLTENYKRKLEFERELNEMVYKFASKGLVEPEGLRSFATDAREFTEEDIERIPKLEKVITKQIAKTGSNSVGELEPDENGSKMDADTEYKNKMNS